MWNLSEFNNFSKESLTRLQLGGESETRKAVNVGEKKAAIMSVFGGDSWVREAQHRKRRVDDLMLSSSTAVCSYKMLSNGKFACVVCPHNPVLDSPLILSMHMKGSRHMAAEARLKERELSRKEEINKRIALFGDMRGISNSTTPFQRPKGSEVKSNPLTERTKKAVREIQCKKMMDQNTKDGSNPSVSTTSSIQHFPNYSLPDHISQPIHGTSFSVLINHNENPTKSIAVTTDPKMLSDWNAELLKQREKEMKFTAAGWKRDCHGKWFKDENVEFDSDEEDPNICLD